MKFAYFHLVPYTARPERTQDWPAPSKRFDPGTGEKLYNAYLDNMVYAEECGFDWVGSRSAEIAGQFGAMFGIAQLKSFDNARNLIDIYRESAKAHGFDPKPKDVLVGLTLSIAEDAEEAKETLINRRRFFADVLGGGLRTAQKLVLP